MKYDAFRERILEEIKVLLPDDVEDVISIPVTKNNGVVYDGITIRDGSNISPTIYLEPYFYQYLDGRSLDGIVSDIVKSYSDYRCEHDFDVKKILDWDYVKSHVVRRVVNYEQNREMLGHAPHIQVEDLAIVYQIVVSDMMDDQGYATIAVKDDFFNVWNVSLEELDETSKLNTRKILPPRLESMAAVYSEATGVELPFLEEMNLYILTNELKLNGAVHVLDVEVMKNVEEQLEGSIYYVIPSSIHEVLLIPYDGEYDAVYLETVINEVNANELSDVDVLSNRAYIIDATEGKFMFASKYEDYRIQKELKEKQKEMEKDLSEPEKKPKL